MVDVIVLGLDALDSDFLEKYLDNGILPAFERYTQESQLAVKPIKSFHTDNLSMPMTIQAWTCIYTGTKKDYHGAGEDEWRKSKVNFAENVSSTIFDDVSEAGLLSHSFRMPMTWPARDISGWMISGFPSGQEKDIADSEVWGIDPTRLPSDYGLVQDRWVSENTDGIRPYLEAEDRKFEIATNLIRDTTEPDVLFWGTQLLDKIGHELTSWKEEQETDISEHEHMRMAYEKIDELLQSFIEVYEPTCVVGISDHGFNRTYGGHSMRATVLEWIDPSATSAGAGEHFDDVTNIIDFRSYLCTRLGIKRQSETKRYVGTGDTVNSVSEAEREHARKKLQELGYIEKSHTRKD